MLLHSAWISNKFCTGLRVATALLVAGLTPNLWMTGQSVFAPPAHLMPHSKAACVDVGDYSLRLVPVNTHHTMTMLFTSSEQQWRQEGRPKIITVLTTSPTG